MTDQPPPVLCTMCEQRPARTTWGFPVCQPCADMLDSLQSDLQEMEADDPELAAAGARVERAGRRLVESQTYPGITGFRTLQFAWGGLFDAKPLDGIHLVRSRSGPGGGTPGPTLCGIDRFAKDAPGWSVGGGVSNPDRHETACAACAAAAVDLYAEPLPITGTFAYAFEPVP